MSLLWRFSLASLASDDGAAAESLILPNIRTRECFGRVTAKVPRLIVLFPPPASLCFEWTVCMLKDTPSNAPTQLPCFGDNVNVFQFIRHHSYGGNLHDNDRREKLWALVGTIWNLDVFVLVRVVSFVSFSGATGFAGRAGSLHYKIMTTSVCGFPELEKVRRNHMLLPIIFSAEIGVSKSSIKSA